MYSTFALFREIWLNSVLIIVIWSYWIASSKFKCFRKCNSFLRTEQEVTVTDRPECYLHLQPKDTYCFL